MLNQTIAPSTQQSLLQAQESVKSALRGAGQTEKTSKLSEAELKKIDKAAKDFEAVFLSEMMKPMFEGNEVDEMFGGGKGEEIFRGFQITEYGKALSERGGIGLAKHVKEQLIRLQEKGVTPEEALQNAAASSAAPSAEQLTLDN